MIRRCLTLAFLIVALSMNYWLGLMLIIVYVRGIIVIFIYIASLVPNEKRIVNQLRLTTLIVLANIASWVAIKLVEINYTKIRSLYIANLWWIAIILMIILISSIIPPKAINSRLKGIKSSK